MVGAAAHESTRPVRRSRPATWDIIERTKTRDLEAHPTEYEQA
jgi:hypothetical protein